MAKRGKAMIIEKSSPGERREWERWGRWDRREEEVGRRGLRITSNKVRISFHRQGQKKVYIGFALYIFCLQLQCLGRAGGLT